MQGKRNYRDSLFRNIFKDKKRLCSLYNALSGENISPKDITINTLRGTFFNDIKNDISFDVGNHTVVLMEHQGSWNPNMPLRMLWYIGKLYRRYIDIDMAYRSNVVKIPAPKFYVLYNGSKAEPEHRIMRLSEAFEGESHSLDLLVDSYNINFAKGRKLLDSCYELRCYSIFVAKVQEYLAAKQELSQAIKAAIRYCRNNELMKEYFKEHEKEVLDMVTFKWDDKRAREIAEEEGMEKGREKGMEKGRAEGRLRILCDLVKDGILSNMDAAKRAGMSLEEFRKAVAML